MRRPTTLALDLEGTLISNAYSQIPRPGLFAFLLACAELAPRIVMFTTVPEARFQRIAADLAAAGEAPAWFPDLEYVNWPGPHKDLAAIPGADWTAVRIVDDDPDRFAMQTQRACWITIPHFDPPYDGSDGGFEAILPTLREQFR